MTPKSFLFCLHLHMEPVIIQLSQSLKFQPLKCMLSWRNSSWKKRLWKPPLENCLGSQAIFMWHHSVWLKIVGKEKNLKLIWYQQNLLFPSNYPIQYLQYYHFGVWSMFCSRTAITQSGTCSYKALQMPFGLNLLDGVRTVEMWPGYCSKWQQKCSNFGLLGGRIS